MSDEAMRHMMAGYNYNILQMDIERMNLRAQLQNVTAERDELRALLRDTVHTWMAGKQTEELLVRIAAAIGPKNEKD